MRELWLLTSSWGWSKRWICTQEYWLHVCVTLELPNHMICRLMICMLWQMHRYATLQCLLRPTMIYIYNSLSGYNESKALWIVAVEGTAKVHVHVYPMLYATYQRVIIVRRQVQFIYSAPRQENLKYSLFACKWPGTFRFSACYVIVVL